MTVYEVKDAGQDVLIVDVRVSRRRGLSRGAVSTDPDIRIDIPVAQNNDRHRFSAEEIVLESRGVNQDREENTPPRSWGSQRDEANGPAVGCTAGETRWIPYGRYLVGTLTSPDTCVEGLQTGISIGGKSYPGCGTQAGTASDPRPKGGI
jgi:hypothetical protein